MSFFPISFKCVLSGHPFVIFFSVKVFFYFPLCSGLHKYWRVPLPLLVHPFFCDLIPPQLAAPFLLPPLISSFFFPCMSHSILSPHRATYLCLYLLAEVSMQNKTQRFFFEPLFSIYTCPSISRVLPPLLADHHVLDLALVGNWLISFV